MYKKFHYEVIFFCKNISVHLEGKKTWQLQNHYLNSNNTQQEKLNYVKYQNFMLRQ